MEGKRQKIETLSAEVVDTNPYRCNSNQSLDGPSEAGSR